MSYNSECEKKDTKEVRLGDYIRRSMENNRSLQYGYELIEGVTNDGIFSTPKIDPASVDLKPYKVVENGAFVYNPSRLDIGSIAYRTEGLCIVSHLYVVFYLNEQGLKEIDPYYLFIYFRRNEFCREISFRNFGSQRPEFSFYDMSDMVIPLPDITVQRRYAAIYRAMLDNQRIYERGLDDLKLTVDAIIEKFKHTTKRVFLGDLVEESDVRNEDGAITNVHGVNKDKLFMPSVASGADLTKYKIVRKGQFACNLMHVGRDVAVPIALQDTDKPLIVSPAYLVFGIKNHEVLPEYVLMWLSRVETNRYAWFISDTSVRSGMEKTRFYEIDIPLPTRAEQESLIEIYIALSLRREINEQLKAQIKDICPILIKGSLEEART